MLRLCFLILALLSSFGALAQQPQPSTNPPLPVDKAEAFLGTWEWQSGTEVFRMTLVQDVAYLLPNGQTRHAILGRHSYTRNGVVVEESFTRNAGSPQGRTLLGSPKQDWSLQMMFVDLTKNKVGDVMLTIAPTAPNTLHFELTPAEKATVGNTPPPSGFTIPTSMTLIRVP